MMKIKTIGAIFLVFVVVANLLFSLFLISEQGNIYKEVRGLENTLATIAQSLGETVEQIAVREDVALERRNSIRVNNANFGENILEVTYNLGSDIATVTKVFQDWGDHSQEPKVAEVPFEAQGRVLAIAFTPVVNPENGSVVVVIKAQSATLGKEIQVETLFDLQNRKVTQDGPYTKEPL